MRTIFLSHFVILFFLLQSCNKQSDTTITEIRYGSQFGMCEGYCYSEVIYNKESQISIKRAWKDTINNPTKIESKKIEYTKWELLTNSIDLSSFYALDNRLGCPDCADGGESWMDIKTNTKSYRVSFEYGVIPKPLEKLVTLIDN